MSQLFYRDILDEYGVRLNVIGQKELLPESVQKAVRKAEDLTRHNDRCVLVSPIPCPLADHLKSAIFNLCMPYTSRDEITTAVQSCIRNANLVASEEPYTIPFPCHSSDLTNPSFRCITAKDIDAQLLTTLGGSPPLDILVRTSGVKRLSDFMLWQVSFTQVLCSVLSRDLDTMV